MIAAKSKKKTETEKEPKEQKIPYETLIEELRQLRKSVKSSQQIMALNESLKNKIAALTEENRSLKGDHKEMSSRYNRMRNILMLGNCSSLEMLIDQYVGYTNPLVRSIVLEAHLIEFDAEERKKLEEVINYMNESVISLQQMLERPFLTIDDSASKKQLKKLITDAIRSAKIIADNLDDFDQTQIKLLYTQFQELQNFAGSFTSRG